MIEITIILAAFIAGFCTGIVLFIILGYVFVKRGKTLGNLVE